jgi:uncharacterized protein
MIDQRDLKNIISRIITLYNPDLIYLFGSYAKGKATDHSDLDILVVKRTNQPRHLRGQDVIAALAQFAIDFDLLFLTPEELAVECNRPFSFLKTVMPEARLVYKRWPAPIYLLDELNFI